MNKLLLYIISFLPIGITSCTINEQTNEIETTGLFWLSAVFLVFLIIWLSFSSAEQAREDAIVKNNRLERFKKIADGTNSSACVIGIDNLYQLIVDETAQNVIYTDNSTQKTIPFQDIMSVELVDDNSTITTKSLKRAIGGAIIGNMIGGRAGMIIGGLSGNSRQKKKVSKVEIIINLRDFTEQPLHIVCFDIKRESNNLNKEISPDDFLYGDKYKQGVADAQSILNLINIVIDRTNATKNSSEKETSSPATPEHKESVTTTSIIDELQRLADLKEQGLINDSEFDLLKQKIIK